MNEPHSFYAKKTARSQETRHPADAFGPRPVQGRTQREEQHAQYPRGGEASQDLPDDNRRARHRREQHFFDPARFPFASRGDAAGHHWPQYCAETPALPMQPGKPRIRTGSAHLCQRTDGLFPIGRPYRHHAPLRWGDNVILSR